MASIKSLPPTEVKSEVKDEICDVQLKDDIVVNSAGNAYDRKTDTCQKNESNLDYNVSPTHMNINDIKSGNESYDINHDEEVELESNSSSDKSVKSSENWDNYTLVVRNIRLQDTDTVRQLLEKALDANVFRIIHEHGTVIVKVTSRQDMNIAAVCLNNRVLNNCTVTVEAKWKELDGEDLQFPKSIWKNKKIKLESEGGNDDPERPLSQEADDNQMKCEIEEGNEDAGRLFFQETYDRQVQLKTENVRLQLVHLERLVNVAYGRDSTLMHQGGLHYNRLLDGLGEFKECPPGKNSAFMCSFSRGKNEAGQLAVGISSNKGTVVDAYLMKPYYPDCVVETAKVLEKMELACEMAKGGHKNFWHKVHMYVNRAQDLMLVMFVDWSPTVEQMERFGEELKDFFVNGEGKKCGITSLYTRIDQTTRLKLLMGSPYIEETIAGLKIQFAPKSQVLHDSYGAEILCESVGELLAPTKETTVLELCCGVGLIGLYLSKSAGQVLSLDMVTEMPRKNADHNKVANYHAFSGELTEVFLDVTQKIEHKDVCAVVSRTINPVAVTRTIEGLRAIPQLSRAVLVTEIRNPSFLTTLCEAACVNRSGLGLPLLPVKVVPVDTMPYTKRYVLLILMERKDLGDFCSRELLLAEQGSLLGMYEEDVAQNFVDNMFQNIVQYQQADGIPYNYQMIVQQRLMEEEQRRLQIEEEQKMCMLIEEQRRMLEEEQMKHMLVQEQRRILLEEEQKRMLVEEQRRKMLQEEQNKHMLMQEQRRILLEEEQKRMLVEEQRRKMLQEEQNKHMLMQEQRRQLLEEEQRRKALEVEHRRRVFEEEPRGLALKEEQRRRLFEEELRKLIMKEEERKCAMEEQRRLKLGEIQRICLMNAEQRKHAFEEELRRRVKKEDNERRVIKEQMRFTNGENYRRCVLAEEQRRLVFDEELRSFKSDEIQRERMMEEHRQYILEEELKRCMLEEEERKQTFQQEQRKCVMEEEQRRRMFEEEQQKRVMQEQQRKNIVEAEWLRRIQQEAQRRNVMVGDYRQEEWKRQLQEEEQRRQKQQEEETQRREEERRKWEEDEKRRKQQEEEKRRQQEENRRQKQEEEERRLKQEEEERRKKEEERRWKQREEEERRQKQEEQRRKFKEEQKRQQEEKSRRERSQVGKRQRIEEDELQREMREEEHGNRTRTQEFGMKVWEEGSTRQVAEERESVRTSSVLGSRNDSVQNLIEAALRQVTEDAAVKLKHLIGEAVKSTGTAAPEQRQPAGANQSEVDLFGWYHANPAVGEDRSMQVNTHHPPPALNVPVTQDSYKRSFHERQYQASDVYPRHDYGLDTDWNNRPYLAAVQGARRDVSTTYPPDTANDKDIFVRRDALDVVPKNTKTSGRQDTMLGSSSNYQFGRSPYSIYPWEGKNGPRK